MRYQRDPSRAPGAPTGMSGAPNFVSIKKNFVLVTINVYPTARLPGWGAAFSIGSAQGFLRKFSY